MRRVAGIEPEPLFARHRYVKSAVLPRTSTEAAERLCTPQPAPRCGGRVAAPLQQWVKSIRCGDSRRSQRHSRALAPGFGSTGFNPAPHNRIGLLNAAAEAGRIESFTLSIWIMPNCDFYAVPEDHEQLLDWLLREGTCRIFELSSEFEMPLREFCTVKDVVSEFSRTYSNGDKWNTVHLQLYVLGAGPPFVPRRVPLDPRSCNGATFRFVAEGWGLVQLYLGALGKGGVKDSHTNHNSIKRAEAWAPVIPEMQSVELWDFKKIAAFSSRLNRQISKMGIAKIASRAVLPGALRLWEEGVSLLPFHHDGSVSLVRKNA